MVYVNFTLRTDLEIYEMADNRVHSNSSNSGRAKFNQGIGGGVVLFTSIHRFPRVRPRSSPSNGA